ncbi:phosphoadenosine phosphosulfate reductase family protein, partial [Peribacillus frigoritolerans]
GKLPFPVMHVDTRWKFQEMYRFRDRMVEEMGLDLITHVNPDGVAQGINPFTHGSAKHTDVMETEGLKQALDKYGFDAAFGGARRDEEVAVEEVLIPYAHGSDPEDVPGEPPKSRWWLSSGAAVAMHVAIIGALVWVMPTPAELILGHGELPKTMQVNFVQLEKKAEP